MKEKLDKLKKERLAYQRTSDAINEFLILIKINDMTKEIYGEDSLEYILSLNELAGNSKYIGRFDIGIPSINKAKEIILNKYDNTSVMYATTLLNEVEILRYKGENDLESKYLEVIDIYEKNNMQIDYEYASVCNNYGLYLQSLNKYEESIEYHNKSKNILKSMLHHKVEYATTLNNLILPLRKINEKKLALEYLNEALEIYKKELGINHANYASVLNNLALIYIEDNENEKAYDILVNALEICKKTFGVESVNYLNVLENFEFVSTMIGKDKVCEKSNILDIVKDYFKKYIKPELEKENMLDLTVGLFGSGSECIKCDDILSRDHDVTLLPVILVKEEKYEEYLHKFEKIEKQLPKEYLGLKLYRNDIINERRGILSFEKFLDKYINYDILTMPEHLLLEFTNGEVFYDNLEFNKLRNKFIYFSEDIRRYKLANKLYLAYQTGQYNIKRMIDRKDKLTSEFILNLFMDNIASIVYILNKEYTPFYKWKLHNLKRLPILGEKMYDKMLELLSLDKENKHKIENFVFEISYLIIEELQKQFGIGYKTLYLYDYIDDIMSTISDENIRELSPYGE